LETAWTRTTGTKIARGLLVRRHWQFRLSRSFWFRRRWRWLVLRHIFHRQIPIEFEIQLKSLFSAAQLGIGDIAGTKLGGRQIFQVFVRQGRVG
jgi:hypothetical protein